MFDLLREVADIAVPVFVVTSMLNVGLTQKPSRILHHLRNWHFLVRMVLVNLVVVPALMIAAVSVVELEPIYAAGLVVFGMAAGAPFLIKLTATSENDLALGATVLMVLMVSTVVVLPVGLPLVIEGVTVDTGAIITSLGTQMLAPLLLGMALAQVAERLVEAVQPGVAWLSTVALYVVIGATLVGYAPELGDGELWKAVAVGLVVLVLALFLGYMMGDGHAHLKDVGGLGTAQRNTPAALIVATQNFDDARALIVITILNTLGIVLLIAAAKAMARENSLAPLPAVADPPPGRDHYGRPITTASFTVSVPITKKGRRP